MRTLQRALVLVALVIANAAHANDRVFDLEGTVKLVARGRSVTENVSATLTLFEDRTYMFDFDGDVSGGIWLEEGTRIQLFQDSPTASETIRELEVEVSDAAGFDVQVTSIVDKETIRRAKTGDIRVIARVTFLFRPGPTGRRPLKITEFVKLVGVLR